MPKIVYYVASSLDGFIAGPGDDIGRFASGGEGVDKYLADLQTFKTVIMGRRTYEFGYRYGLQPGQPAYAHMQHHIFSDSLEFDRPADTVQIEPKSLDRVRDIRDASATDVYLCGGGVFAGWLLENDLIDRLQLKLNPILLGGGVKLFGDSTKAVTWKLLATQTFKEGLTLLTYDINR